MKPVYIIAEAGVNHNGRRDMAFQLVDVAVEAGVDAIKFQTFKTENLVIKNTEKADYQKQRTSADESQFAMLKRLELSYEVHHELVSYCKTKGIQFLSTAFDSESLNFLVNGLMLRTLKIPSGEITNGPFLLEHANTGCDLILSTGMSTLGEIEEALGVIAFGLMYGGNGEEPSRRLFQEAYMSTKGQQLLHKKITLLHCTTEYPAPPEEINLNTISTMHNAFGLPTGYSDHSAGIVVPIAAAALGVSLIEKHFTLDKTLYGPDHEASLNPDELKEMVGAVRLVEQVMGSGVKCPTPSELKNRNIVRKSLVAGSDIGKADLFSEDNLAIKRPGTGRSPMEYWDILEENSQKDYHVDEVIC